MISKEYIVNKIFFLLVFSVFSLGCSVYRANYDVGLSEVERPSDAKGKYGKQEIVSFEDKNEDETVTKYRFEDGMIEMIVWLEDSRFFPFQLRNKTEHSIKIIWDKSSYVDENSISKRIFQKQMDGSRPDLSRLPTIIPKGARVNNFILPGDDLSDLKLELTLHRGIDTKPLFPLEREWNYEERKEEEVSDFNKRVGRLMGKKMHLLLALQIEGVTNEYMFSFLIHGVEVKKHKLNFLEFLDEYFTLD